MKNVVNLGNNLSVSELLKIRRNIITVNDNGNDIVLSNMIVSDYFNSEFVYDNNYVVAYSYNFDNPKNISIDGAYSIHNKRLLDLDNNNNKLILKYMFFCSRSFDLACVLQALNKNDLGILNNLELEDFINYLTLGNENISRDDVIKYILDYYSFFSKYDDINTKFTAVSYRNLQNKIMKNRYYFRTMPQVFENNSFILENASKYLDNSIFDSNDFSYMKYEAYSKKLSK